MNCICSVFVTSLCLIIPSQYHPEETYRIERDGKSVGYEKFQIAQTDGSITIKSSGEILSGNSSQRIITITEIQNRKIDRYMLEVSKQSGIEKYDMRFSNGRADVEIEAYGKKAKRVKDVSDDATLLDKNVWHHYRFLLARYDLRLGGIQRFNVFIPQAALRQYTAEVEMKKTTSFEFRRRKIEAYRFEILLADTYDVIIITDEKKTPLLIEIPSEDTKVRLE